MNRISFLVINKLLTQCLYATQLTDEQKQIDSLKEHFIKSFCKFENIPKIDPLIAW